MEVGFEVVFRLAEGGEELVAVYVVIGIGDGWRRNKVAKLRVSEARREH